MKFSKENNWISLAALVIQIRILQCVWIYSLLSVRLSPPGKFPLKMLYQTSLLFSYYRGPLTFPPHALFRSSSFQLQLSCLYDLAGKCPPPLSSESLSHPRAQHYTLTHTYRYTHRCGCMYCWLDMHYIFFLVLNIDKYSTRTRANEAISAAFNSNNKCQNQTK